MVDNQSPGDVGQQRPRFPAQMALQTPGNHKTQKSVLSQVGGITGIAQFAA